MPLSDWPRPSAATISTDTVHIDSSYLATHPEARLGNFVCLRVGDAGIGMDPATRDRIFEPFFTTKEIGKGTGLGLATVYGVVKQHDGWIEAESEPGVSATFNIFFAATTQPVQARTEDTTLAAQVRGGKETILIVEDEPVLRQMAESILQDCGYNTLEAASGREALDLWESHRDSIDLVLTNVVMPEGVSGMELASKLLASKPKLKIVFASGYSMDDIDTAIVRKGAAGFLQKPYTHITLAKAVRDCLDKQ